MSLFYWWYMKPGFTLIYFVTLGFMLILNDRKNVKSILICLGLFMLFSNPVWFYKGFMSLWGSFNSYFSLSETKNTGFPNILQTITEAKKHSLTAVFLNIMNIPVIAIAGLVLFIPLIGFKFKKMLPVLPVFALGLLVFKSSNRFGMFLAPFIGVGLGFIVHLIWDYMLRKLKVHSVVKEAVPYVVVMLLFFSISGTTAFSFVPKPSISSDIFTSFIDMRKQLPKETAIYSWWDYGYAIEDVTGFNTFHDGGAQGSAKTYFIARSLVSGDQQELFNTVHFLNENNSTAKKIYT